LFFLFYDDVLTIGVSFFARLAERFLEKAVRGGL